MPNQALNVLAMIRQQLREDTAKEVKTPEQVEADRLLADRLARAQKEWRRTKFSS
jgi:hypothetical protein